MVRRVVASVVATLAFQMIAFADGELAILSFPIGLVFGEQTIEVDLGEAPHVYLLELVQRNDEGEVIASARRWVNRPGQEAELSIRLDRAPSNGLCTGRVQWFHPDKANPISLEVTDDSRPLLIGDDHQSFRFPCADSDEPRVIAGSAIFPDDLSIAGRPNEVVDPDGDELQAEAGTTDRQPPDLPALEARVDVTAVTVLVTARDSSGSPITDLRATDISVTEDGHQATVLDLEPLAGVVALQPTGFSTTGADQMAPELQTKVGELPVAIFADLEFSGAADLFAAVDLLAARSDWLASLGPVSIVEARNGLSTVLDGSRDADQIRSALLELAEARSGPGEIDQIRTRFLRDNGPMRDQGASSNPSEESLIPSVRFAIHEEDQAVRRHLDRIQNWAEAESATNPGLLLLVGAGFDEDPREFYQPTVERRSPENASKVNLESRDLGVRRSLWVEDLGRELAAGGWLVVPFVGRSVGMGGSSIASEHSGRGKLNEFYSNRGTGVGTFTPSWLQVDPLGSQRHLAAPSGGGVVLGKKDLNMLIEQSGGWYQLTYQVDRPPAGIYRELNVTTTRDDAVLQTTGVVLSGTSEGRSEARLRQLLDGSGSAGELPVDVSISEPRLGEDQVLVADATVAVSFAPIAPLFVEGGERPLRFSVAVQAGNEDPVIQHELETAIGLLGGMYFDFPIEWSVPPETLAVIVEDLKSGAWGGWKSDLSELAARERSQK